MTHARSARGFLVLHALLSLWAVHCWNVGPFRGAAVADGAQTLLLAWTGGTDNLVQRDSLYPWLLGRLLVAGTDIAWVVGALNLLASLAVLAGIGVLCRLRAPPQAQPWAMGLYVLSGSPLAFMPQPLPVLCGTALLVWGVIVLHRLRERLGLVRAAGALLAAALALFVAVPLLLDKAPWPGGWGLELRLGNGGARSGSSELRIGPALDRLLLEPVVAAWETGASRVDADGFHVAKLADEIAADPRGAAATLLRKLFLFWHRTELVSGADFRHALAPLDVMPLLLLSFGLIAPLALAGFRRRCDPWIWLPVAGVVACNVIFVTGARERLPALPFLCVAAGTWLARRPSRRELAIALIVGLLLNLNWTGRALLRPGEGELQEGALLLQQGLVDPAAERFTRANELGGDPRALLLLGNTFERAVTLHGDLTLRDRAERCYRQVLEQEPLAPDAVDGVLRILISQQRAAEALAFGAACVAADPRAGAPRLTLATVVVRLQRKEDTRQLLIDGHRNEVLRALAHGDREGALHGATELLRLNAADAHLDALLQSGAH